MVSSIFKVLFLLTHPSRGATAPKNADAPTMFISTHTPLTGCNGGVTSIPLCLADFYSHTPHGVQHFIYNKAIPTFEFLLTHPSRGATFCSKMLKKDDTISTHTPLTGCNMLLSLMLSASRISTHTPLTGCNEYPSVRQFALSNFYSHTPHGVQHAPIRQHSRKPDISTHTPLTGCNIAEWR